MFLVKTQFYNFTIFKTDYVKWMFCWFLFWNKKWASFKKYRFLHKNTKQKFQTNLSTLITSKYNKLHFEKS